MKKPIIAIDGPAGSGKSTVAKLVAQILNLTYLDTGAMYRTATLACVRKSLDFSNEEKIYSVVENSNIDINYNDNKFEIYLNGENVSSDIRSPLVNTYVSKVSEILPVRQLLIKKQRQICKSGAVIEGRDIGTVVFPDADFKFFLDADFDTRVERRYKEMLARNISVSREEIIKDLKTRDENDKTRRYGPLKKAEDAIYIDTTNLGIDEVVSKIISYLGRADAVV